MTGPAVIIGNPSSIFPRQLASYWRCRGMDVVIVTHSWGGEEALPDGTRILSSAAHETSLSRKQLAILSMILKQVERADLIIEKNRYRQAMGAKADYRPAFTGPVVGGISIARFVRSLRPRFVFGQEAFAYGLATALCFGFPKILMPWGGDIYRYAETSILAFAMVKYALQHVDLVCPGSAVAARHICTRYRVPEHRVHAVPWGVDQQMFAKADRDERRRICRKYDINPGAMIFMNARRFRPEWGCDLALEAFIRLAEEYPSFHFVMLGGLGTEPYVHAARHQLIRRGLEHRFTLFEGDIPLSDCAELMSVSDVFVSLMRTRDMGSASILQAASAGGAPVLRDQEEYRKMERLGFRALFVVNVEDVESVVDALRSYADNQELRQDFVNRNQVYLTKYEDYDRQMRKLLDLIDEVCDAYGRISAER